MMERVKQAVILAAGEGQRLRPFTALKPKVMIPIANRPILQYVVEALARNGIADIVMVVGYRREQVQDYFGSGQQFGVRISYVTQKTQIGTAHALKQARELTEDRFLVLGGDDLIEVDTIAPLLLSQPNALLIKQMEPATLYGVVTVEAGVVRDVVEKPQEPPSNLVSTGIYLLNREIFPFLEEEVDLPLALRRMIAQGHTVLARETEGVWLDAVYPWDILKVNQQVLSKTQPRLGGTLEEGVIIKGSVVIGQDTVVRSHSYIVGPAIIGDNCDIGPHVCIFPFTSIGDNTVVEAFSLVRNSLLGRNLRLGPGSCVEDSVVDQRCVLGCHFMARSEETRVEVNGDVHRVRCGAMIGEDCAIGDNVMVQPGVRVGFGAQIKASKVIAQDIPERSLVV